MIKRLVKASIFKRGVVPIGRHPVSILFLSLLYLVSSNLTFADNSTGVGRHSAGIGFGQVILMGEFADHYTNDLGFDLLYGYKASDEFELMVNYGYLKHVSNDKLNTLTTQSLVPSLRMNLSEYDQFMVFIFGGLGFYQVSETIGPRAGSALTFGFNAGPGVDLKLNDNFKFGFLASLHNVFSKNDPDAKNPSGQGMTIGGAYSKLFLTIQYIFN